MTLHGSEVSQEIDGLLRHLIQKYATKDNIFELESIFSSAGGVACAEFRIRQGLIRRKEQAASKREPLI